MKKRNVFLVCSLIVYASVFIACKSSNSEMKHAESQMSNLLKDAEKVSLIPRTVLPNGETKWIGSSFDWTEGFFPGTCWYLYEYTKNEKWKMAAEEFQAKFINQTNESNHDLGFVFGCSYGNGYRLTGNEAYKKIMIEASNTLIGRFSPITGVIKSWDTDKGWQSERGWSFPVIIDNMMNLELLFDVSVITGDDKYKQVAIIHANTTMKNHYRKDFSSYHVVDYDSITGEVQHRQTAQGLSDESSWARGQAWGLYGYITCYRYTKDKKYLDMACNIANYIMNNPTLAKDKIPFWDYSDPKIPNTFVDVSAAAITASALYELEKYCPGKYLMFANEIMDSLATDKYTAGNGENNNFLLKHSVGSLPHGNEIDVPLNYADYYYVEALMRREKSSN